MFLSVSHCTSGLITFRPMEHAAINLATVHKKQHMKYVTLSMALN